MAVSSMLLLSGYIAALAVTFLKFNEVQPEPYMDEIFHVPQAQNYCHNHFHHWDPKITTLPGLYVISQAIVRVAAVLIGEDVPYLCCTQNLRLTNLLLMVLCLPISYGISLHTAKHLSARSSSLNLAVAVCLFPLLFFNAFLYYTDVGSTFFVLGMYLSGLHGHYVVSSMLGTCAVLFRQTNIVWLAFTAGTALMNFILKVNVLEHDSSNIFKFLREVALHFLSIIGRLTFILMPYFIAIFGFLVFIYKNGSIVVGDKTSHQACLNVPQLFYFAGFSLAFSFPTLLCYIYDSHARSSLKSCIRSVNKLLLFGVVCLFCLVAVAKLTYVHEYLVSDNRHYTFYIWKRIFELHWMIPYALVPVYVVCGWVMIEMLLQSQHWIWTSMFVICTAAAIVPQRLLEFRYFIVPYVIYRLHLPVTGKVEVMFEMAIYTAVNLVTLYIFLFKPFYWVHEPNSIQRFMW